MTEENEEKQKRSSKLPLQITTDQLVYMKKLGWLDKPGLSELIDRLLDPKMQELIIRRNMTLKEGKEPRKPNKEPRRDIILDPYIDSKEEAEKLSSQAMEEAAKKISKI